MYFYIENKYIPAFEKFDSVVAGCFGQSIDDTYASSIREFQDVITKLPISITPKLHALFCHVQDFIELKGKPLGFYSEQASESVHFAFTKHAEDYKLSKSKINTEKLLRSVRSFNAIRQ